MRSVVIATNNRHKLEEIQAILNKDIRLQSLEDIGFTDELAEDQDTLEGNSLQKAAFVNQRFQVDCFADDTGLEVESLNGAPGVYSARYAGPQRNSSDNIDLLLKNLRESSSRKARFRTVITLIAGNNVHQFEGIVNGVIAHERKGNGGFGYDPVFIPDGFDVTMAEMSMEEKNQISHRAIAVRKLANFLNSLS